MDEFGPLNLQPHPGRQWAAVGGKNKEPDREPRPRRRATYTRTAGVRHLFAAYDLGGDKLYGHVKPPRPAPGSWSSAATCAPSTRPTVRIAIVCDNFSPAPDHRADAGRGLGRGEQRRDRLHPDQLLLAQPHRGPVHRAALLRPRRHRPPQPQGAGQHDPPLHHLAQQPRRRPTTTPHRRPGERCLTRPWPHGRCRLAVRSGTIKSG